MSRAVQVWVDDKIAHVQLHRPRQHNALDLDLFRGLVAAQEQLRRRRDVRAVVLSGAGVDFCSGLDVKSVLRSPRALLAVGWKPWPGRANLAQRVSTGWTDLPMPVIAAVQGRCWGGGLQVALGADFRVAAPDASLCILESKWGLIPDMGGTLALRTLLGRDQALKLVLTAEQIDGHRALELGLVTEVAADPLERATALAAQLATRSPDAVAAAKRLFASSWTASGWLTLARETWYQMWVLAGRNQRIAARRAKGQALDYVARGRAWHSPRLPLG